MIGNVSTFECESFFYLVKLICGWKCIVKNKSSHDKLYKAIGIHIRLKKWVKDRLFFLAEIISESFIIFLYLWQKYLCI